MVSNGEADFAAILPWPSRRASSSRDCATVSGHTPIGSAPGLISSVKLSRDVTTTMQPGQPGNSGRTCAVLAASSSSMGMRLPASTDRYSAARPSRPSHAAAERAWAHYAQAYDDLLTACHELVAGDIAEVIGRALLGDRESGRDAPRETARTRPGG